MNIFNPEDFESIDLNFTSDEIFKTVEQFKFINLPEKDFTAEWCINDLPRFIKTFYSMIENRVIPTQEDFYNQYVDDNEKYFQDKKFSSTTWQGIKARVYRAHASLMRDLHFATFLKEKGETIIYNKLLDSKYGVDIMVIKNGRYYALLLYINTSRSLQAREGKKDDYPIFANASYIECPLVFRDSLICGDFFLFGENQYKVAMNIIMLKSQQKNLV